MFETKRVPFQQIRHFAKTDLAYTLKDPLLRPYYGEEASLEGLMAAARARKAFPVDRQLLSEEIARQYSGIHLSGKLAANIGALAEEDTFTITTAHQPVVGAGPLYVIYKALNTIRLAEELKAADPEHQYVPVFVIGGEDHDFEEINHCRLYGREIVWDTPSGGPVGRMSTDSLQGLVEEISDILGEAGYGPALSGLLQAAYAPGKTYNRATLEWMHGLLGHLGLLVFHMDNPACKSAFAPAMRKELLEQRSLELVGATQEKLDALGFKAQAHVREVNLFLIDDFSRRRILKEGDQYGIHGTEQVFSEEQILSLLEAEPERFSPNVVMRPLLQETILPNIAYIGGGGEIAYWLERKSQFADFGVFYPVLLRRNSLALVEASIPDKLAKWGFELNDSLRGEEALIREYLEARANADNKLDAERSDVEAIYERVLHKSRSLDPTLEKPVMAELTKVLQGMAHLEQKMLRAEKLKHEVALKQIGNILQKLFPGDNLQERTDNFMPWYVKYGPTLFDEILEAANPLETDFIFLQMP